MANYIIVDAYNLFHRAKYATKGDATLKSGIALHICLNSIKKAWNDFQGSHVVLCLEGHSWRYALYPQYKAQRKAERLLLNAREKEEEEVFQEVLDQFIAYLKEKTNVTVLQHKGIEADDFIARWTDLHPEDQHIIVSGDTDFYQLLAPNVRIYDGVNQRLITTDGMFDEKGQPILSKVKRKLTVKEVGPNWFSVEDENIANVVTKGTMKHKSGDYPYTIDDGTFVVKKNVAEKISIGDKIEFEGRNRETVEPEWELFKKIIRGDSSDNIFSAYPKVRETKLREAFDDRQKKGFAWNNLMLQVWTDHNGDEHRVLDRYSLNRQLIDLRAQPDDIRSAMDGAIMEAVQKKPVKGVGIWFMRFCEEHSLVNISKVPHAYTAFLGEPYLKS
jgi:hypothetical protein